MLIYFAAHVKDYRGLYDADAEYKKGNIVSDSHNSAYLCLVDNEGRQLSDTNYWARLPSVVNDAAKTAENKIVFEEFTGLSEVGLIELLDVTIPAEVVNAHVTQIEKTSFIINWEESVSLNVKEYVIYLDQAVVATIPATLSKMQPLSYQVSNASPSTEYRYTIKARSQTGYESKGINLIVRTNGKYALQMNGVSDYIKLPSLIFDKIELTCHSTEVTNNSWSYYVDARPGITAAYMGINGNGNIQYSDAWYAIYMNGKNLINLNKAVYEKVSITLLLKSSAAADINIFSDFTSKFCMMGKLYSVQIFLKGLPVAAYNLTEPSLNEEKIPSSPSISILKDQTGNGKDAALFGGTWIIN